MTPEVEEALAALLSRIEQQDEIIAMIVETLEGQNARVLEATDAANKLAHERRVHMGRSIKLPGQTTTEQMLEAMTVAKGKPKRYDD
jgi:hypothetical protein